jgi:hypothetical protein
MGGGEGGCLGSLLNNVKITVLNLKNSVHFDKNKNQFY